MKINLWDVLDKNQELKDQFYDAITDFISDKTGYCVNSYNFDNKIVININNLDLDKEE